MVEVEFHPNLAPYSSGKGMVVMTEVTLEYAAAGGATLLLVEGQIPACATENDEEVLFGDGH